MRTVMVARRSRSAPRGKVVLSVPRSFERKKQTRCAIRAKSNAPQMLTRDGLLRLLELFPDDAKRVKAMLDKAAALEAS